MAGGKISEQLVQSLFFARSQTVPAAEFSDAPDLAELVVLDLAGIDIGTHDTPPDGTVVKMHEEMKGSVKAVSGGFLLWRPASAQAIFVFNIVRMQQDHEG
jgi:hypothetical protein